MERSLSAIDSPAVQTCTAFEGTRRIASGELSQVALKVKRAFDRGERGPLLVFDNQTSEQIELDLRGSADDLKHRLKAISVPPQQPLESEREARGPGRPKLGVVAREVTLLPRHWQWLAEQPGGASVALRKLVESARKSSETPDHIRRTREVAYRFMSAMAGNLPGFEEATRALFAGDVARFQKNTNRWPQGIRDHARRLAGAQMQGAVR